MPSHEQACGDGTNRNRLILTDRKTGMRFLIDTGADISVIPRSAVKTRPLPSELKLYAANGTPIRTFGEKRITVDLGLRRRFEWDFLVADVTIAILGADFLERYKLLVDLANRRLRDEQTSLYSPGRIGKSVVPTVTTIDATSQYHHILKDFADLTKPCPKKEGIHNVHHHIITRGTPVAERARRLPPAKFKAAREAIEQMIQEGICQPSSSSWASPIHLVPTATGQWRLCGDYRRLNAQTIPDRYPLPHIHDFAYSLQGSKIFSKIDLKRAFHQVPLAPEDRHKSAVITPFGLYEFNVMTFGLCNAAQSFQRLMDTAMRGLKFCHAYIDDIIIASVDQQSHEQHLKTILERLRKFGLSINFSKCVFGVKEVDYLGYNINEDGLKPLKKRVEAIINYKKPKTVQELRRFLGIVNFYRRFIKNAAQVQAPLHAYSQGMKKRDKREIAWTPEANQAFESCKSQLANASLLAHPLANTTLTLHADASDSSMGAVLEQRENGMWRPLGFYSKKLTDTQKRYSTYDRELLAIYSGLKYFKHLVEGQRLIIKTDHKPITYAFCQKSDKASPRQMRQLDYIAQFTTDIIHITGDKNTVADALSRVQAIEFPVIVSTEDIAKAQEEDEELKEYLRSNSSSLQLKKLNLENGDTTLYCDISGSDVRPYIPLSLRRRIFNTVHNLAHPGSKPTRKLLSRKFVWPSMRKDVTEWVRTCLPCQRNKILRHVKTIPEKIAIPDERFRHIHMDIIGPLPLSKNCKYCLTIIDRYTRWPEAIPIAETSTDTIVNVFYSTWIARFGAPSVITTDRGSQFESQLFKTLTDMIGANRISTTAYHPSANGMIERWHRTLKAAIRCHTSSNWVDVLPSVLLGLRTSIKEDLKTSSAELVYGTTMRLPGEFFIDITPTNQPRVFLEGLRSTMREIRPSPASHHQRRKAFIHEALHTCTHVFIRVDASRRPLESPYEGPYLIVERVNDKVYKVDIKGNIQTVSIERLKPAFFEQISPDAEEAETEGPSTHTRPEQLRTYSNKKKIRFAV